MRHAQKPCTAGLLSVWTTAVAIPPAGNKNIRMKKILLFCAAPLLMSAALAREPAFFAAPQTLAPPPAADSQTVRDELAELHRIQSARTAAQIAQAQADEKQRTMFIYRDVLGEKFDPDALPLTAAFARRIKKDASIAAAPLKKMFHRMRPYRRDQTLQPVCKIKSADNSYPSEHSTVGYLNALILGDMLPEKRTAILARADAYAYNRLVCGVHYPSDVQAGRQLALALHAAMQANPRFRQEAAAATVELRQALGLPMGAKQETN
jgi:acid phosphatase (class A)